jgi:hypothetical protein
MTQPPESILSSSFLAICWMPFKGKWSPHAKIVGTRNGTETENGIIIKDAKGAEWKMYRRKSTLDNDDHITIRLMCSGETQMGTRTR